MKASKLTLGTVALVLLSVSAWASDKMKANIQIFKTVSVGSTQLAPGEYELTWTGTGTNAEATFSQGKKVVATVPAQVTQTRMFSSAKVGDHFVGRFCCSPPPTSGRTHGDPGRFQVLTGGFTTDLGDLLDLPQRPS